MSQKSTNYKLVFYLCTFLSAVGFLCLILDIAYQALVLEADSVPGFGTSVAVFSVDIWFAAGYLLHRKTAASGTTFTKTSSVQLRKIHNRNSRLFFSIVFIGVALITPILDIDAFQDQMRYSRGNKQVDLDAYATDLFFCSGDVASLLSLSGNGRMLSACRLRRSRMVFCFFLILVGLVEAACYWRTDIDTPEWASRGSSNENDNSDENTAKSVDPVLDHA